MIAPLSSHAPRKLNSHKVCILDYCTLGLLFVGIFSPHQAYLRNLVTLLKIPHKHMLRVKFPQTKKKWTSLLTLMNLWHSTSSSHSHSFSPRTHGFRSTTIPAVINNNNNMDFEYRFRGGAAFTKEPCIF
jgi:hypothetical protein